MALLPQEMKLCTTCEARSNDSHAGRVIWLVLTANFCTFELPPFNTFLRDATTAPPPLTRNSKLKFFSVAHYDVVWPILELSLLSISHFRQKYIVERTFSTGDAGDESNSSHFACKMNHILILIRGYASMRLPAHTKAKNEFKTKSIPMWKSATIFVSASLPYVP